MEGYAHIANSPILWAITAIAIGLVLLQAFLILKKTITAAKHVGISNDKMKTAFKTGFISSFGPTIVIVIGMVSLLVVVGGPTALMRLSYIGNVAYELLAAQFAAESYGMSLTNPVLPPEVFCIALWCMALGCIGWIVFTALATDKMGKVTQKFSGKSAKVFGAVSTGAMLGAYAYLNAGYAVSMDGNTVAMVVGALVMLVVLKAYKKTHMKWLNEWSLTLAMVGGMIVGAFFYK